MYSFKMILLTIAFGLISTSIAFAGGATAWSQDHSFRIGVWDVASEKGVRDNYPDSIAFNDHSFREGVQIPERKGIQSTESELGVRGYYPETDMRQDSSITDDSIHLQLIDGPTD